eukprot:GHVU01016229.1.p1 GENE.GHVU01016229.1~~GHVU01016229.1.p1  ORF type:complete len:180 (-),score=3.23 GHVU01016229.1:1276-1782(-)
MSFTYFPALLEHTLTRVGLYLTIDVEYFRSLGIEHSVLAETLTVYRGLIYDLMKKMDIIIEVKDLTDFRHSVNFIFLEYTFLVREEAVDAPDFAQLMTAIQRTFQTGMGDPIWTDLFADSFWRGPLRDWDCLYDKTILGNILYHLQSSGNLKVLFRLSCVEVTAACTH